MAFVLQANVEREKTLDKKVKSLKANNLMNLLSVKRKGHGVDECIRSETPNSRGLQLAKTQALLYN